MESSVFLDKVQIPNENDLEIALGNNFSIWREIRDFVIEKYPSAVEEWFSSGKKYGWAFRIKDKKRAIVYLSPRVEYFIVTFVYGQKATDKILTSDISQALKNDLMGSKVYMEGRVLRIDVQDSTLIGDIKKLIEIKLRN
jgi:hypothetical protein